jgi:anti-anti-sigma factor
MIKIEEKRRGTFLLILEGCVDHAASPQLRRVILQLCKKDPKWVIVDFTRVDQIDCSCIATLAERQQQLRKRNIRITLAGLNAKLEAHFDLTNLRTFFEMVPNAEEAV